MARPFPARGVAAPVPPVISAPFLGGHSTRLWCLSDPGGRTLRTLSSLLCPQHMAPTPCHPVHRAPSSSSSQWLVGMRHAVKISTADCCRPRSPRRASAGDLKPAAYTDTSPRCPSGIFPHPVQGQVPNIHSATCPVSPQPPCSPCLLRLQASGGSLGVFSHLPHRTRAALTLKHPEPSYLPPQRDS